MNRLENSFFDDSTQAVAQKLLGKLLVRQKGKDLLVGKIVETECYTFHDPASHCYQKQTTRNQALFGSVGHAYVYTIYGIHSGFNVVAHNAQDHAGGVLIRAIEPVMGREIMQKNRPAVGYSLSNGPGKLTQAFAIDTRFYGYNLLQSEELFLAEIVDPEPFTICATPRIGISKAQEYKGRFIIAHNKWITPHRYNNGVPSF